MKKTIITITILGLGIIALMTGCGDTRANSRVTSGQNSVEDILQAAAEEQAANPVNEETADISEETSTAEETVVQAETADETAAEVPSDSPETTVQNSVSEDLQTADISSVGTDYIDLSEMNSNMVYSEVFAIMTEPEKYMGKNIKMTGICNRYTDINTGADYYACIIQDAAACCAQGIEFRLPEGMEYPKMGDEITITGTFGSYTENDNVFYVLLNTQLIA